MRSLEYKVFTPGRGKFISRKPPGLGIFGILDVFGLESVKALWWRMLPFPSVPRPSP